MNSFYKAFIVVCFLMSFVSANTRKIHRKRGSGLYQTESSNTVGKGNLWTTLRVIGFIWDDSPDSKQPRIFPFVEANAEFGVINRLALYLRSRPVSHMWNSVPQIEHATFGIKFSFVDNRLIQLHALGFNLQYKHSIINNFSSIAGFRNGGTGYSPEGFIAAGGTLQALLAYDLDCISINSKLPFKLLSNIGIYSPINKDLYEFKHYLFHIGILYYQPSFEIFTEFSFQGVVHSPFQSKIFDRSVLNLDRRWEIAFLENPIYFTLGGRVIYSNGMILSMYIPLLLSQNKGSSITTQDKISLNKKLNFLDEVNRGITDPFDPWYAQWKIILNITYPIKFTPTSSEIMRDYLLLKNRKQINNFDIDKKLNRKEKKLHETEIDESERLERLKKIKQQRESIQSDE